MKTRGLTSKKGSLKKSEVILISTMVLIGLNAFISTFFLSNRFETYNLKLEELAVQEARRDQLEVKYKNYDRFEAELKNLGFRKMRMLSELPKEVVQESILYDISETALKNNISLQSIAMGENTNLDYSGEYESISGEEDIDSEYGIGYMNNQDLSLDINGEIDNLYSFIRDIEERNQMISLSNLSINPSYAKKFSGSMTMNYLSCEDGLLENIEFELPEYFGKKNPFKPYNGYSGLSIDVGKSELPDETVPSDFIVHILQYKKDTPAFIMGPFDRLSKEIYSSDFGEASGHITIEEMHGRIRLDYGFGKQLTDFVEFNKGTNITIDIFSRDRYMDGDIQKLKLTIENRTDQKINIRVNDEDEEKPFVELIEIEKELSEPIEI